MLGNCWGPITPPWEDVQALLIGTQWRACSWPTSCSHSQEPPGEKHDSRQGVTATNLGTTAKWTLSERQGKQTQGHNLSPNRSSATCMARGGPRPQLPADPLWALI